ncbi:MAG: rhomboid family intramembrane serine protease [Kofleriaceae bacterium]
MAGKFRFTYNAPVVLTFAVASTVVLLWSEYVNADAMRYFAAWPEFHGAPSYIGLFSHVLGHAGWDHLLGNFSMILLIGPILEERHGSKGLLGMIAITALVTGLVQVTIGDGFLVGASGIVFMMILLASMANIRAGEIPLTFVAVAVLYLGREVVAAFDDDKISQMAHLIGGVTGAAFGFLGAGPSTPRPGKPARPVVAAAAPPPTAPRLPKD